MENENIEIVNDEQQDEVAEVIEEVRPNRESKSKTMMYTAISVVLFFVLYFGVRIASDYINRDYYLMNIPSEMSDEQLKYIDEYTGIIADENAELGWVSFEKTRNSKLIRIGYFKVHDVEKFIENNITYEYGNPVYYDRTGATGYVNIENPMIECVVYDDYAEYISDDLTAEIMAIVKDGEKTYN